MNEKENLDFDNGVVSSLDEGNSSYLITVVIPTSAMMKWRIQWIFPMSLLAGVQ